MADETKALLNKESVLLITGGAKGITAQCAVRLAEFAQCKFILVGRSPSDRGEPEWAAGVESADDLQKRAIDFFNRKGEKVTPKELQREISKILSSREIAATLAAIKTHGGQAVYISADVTDELSLAPQVHSTVNEFGAVTGIIHGAGNLADKLIENKTGKDFDLVVDTKVKGLRSVLQSVEPGKLKFLVLFSSVAGFFGNAGQADYAIANEILNKSAHILRKTLPDCRVISINWGPWDSGMVSPQLKKVFERRNIPLIQTEEGVQTLVDELTRDARVFPQVVVGSPIFAQNEVNVNNGHPLIIHRRISLEGNPFVQDHRIGPNPVLPATCASSWLINVCESSNPGWQFHRMRDFKVLKGITFSEGTQTYKIKLEKLESKNGEKSFDVIVTSDNESARKIFHYSGQVDLIKVLPDAPNHHAVKKLDLDRSKFINGRELYKNGTLFHGPRFQGIQEVMQLDEGSVITRVMLPEMPVEEQGQFLAGSANPYINDAIVQSLLIWSQKVYDAPCLPSRLREWVQYRSIPFGVPVWAALSVNYHNQNAVSGDILVMDEAGDEYFHYSGLEGTISKQLSRFIGRKAK